MTAVEKQRLALRNATLEYKQALMYEIDRVVEQQYMLNNKIVGVYLMECDYKALGVTQYRLYQVIQVLPHIDSNYLGVKKNVVDLKTEIELIEIPNKESKWLRECKEEHERLLRVAEMQEFILGCPSDLPRHKSKFQPSLKQYLWKSLKNIIRNIKDKKS